MCLFLFKENFYEDLIVKYRQNLNKIQVNLII